MLITFAILDADYLIMLNYLYNSWKGFAGYYDSWV